MQEGQAYVRPLDGVKPWPWPCNVARFLSIATFIANVIVPRKRGFLNAIQELLPCRSIRVFAARTSSLALAVSLLEASGSKCCKSRKSGPWVGAHLDCRKSVCKSTL